MACVYRPVIKQGNFLTDDMIAKVKLGMTETQVEYVLGPAMVKDPFHPDRWDYVYYNNTNNGSPVQYRHVLVIFKDGKVSSIEQGKTKPQGS
ncbi:MAG: outer membrane protein assembly factor BamE [Gammaproteobacteria bacterium]